MVYMENNCEVTRSLICLVCKYVLTLRNTLKDIPASQDANEYHYSY